MKRIEKGSFVLYLSDKEWDKIIKDEIKTLGLKLGMGLRKQTKEQDKILPNKMYYNVTHEELEKLIEETIIKIFGK